MVLNVDDYAPGRYTRTTILRQAGFIVLEAGTGSDALAQLAHRPDVVLLDINLPDMDGMQVCKQIRGNPDIAETLVLHLTASSILPTDQVAGLDSGADAYLTEPIDAGVLIATIRALLRMRRAEEGLRRRNDSLRSLTDMMSHELREPVRQLSVYAELLQERLAGKLGSEEEMFLSNVLAGGRRLNSLIEAVLSYSRAIYGAVTMRDVSAQEALEVSLAELELLIGESGAHVICEEPMPQVMSDKLSLARIFSNLIANSVKYRGAEAPEIRISAASEGDWIRFCVADNGIGIEPKYHALIFDVFKRLHGAEYPGTGIGLSLCRRMLESMGGTIWVESEAGKGAKFYFTVPRPGKPGIAEGLALADRWM